MNVRQQRLQAFVAAVREHQLTHPHRPMENLIDVLITANSTKAPTDPYEELLLDWWESNFFADDGIVELYAEETARR